VGGLDSNHDGFGTASLRFRVDQETAQLIATGDLMGPDGGWAGEGRTLVGRDSRNRRQFDPYDTATLRRGNQRPSRIPSCIQLLCGPEGDLFAGRDSGIVHR